MSTFEPAYRKLLKDGVLQERARAAWALLERCEVCPRLCGATRLNGQTGDCRTADKARVSSVHPHYGEERPLVGRRGSGTIFFSWCNLHCQFCQNFELSAYGEGREVTSHQLASYMLELQAIGCHNINLVSPTHVVPQILSALVLAAQQGLSIPLVYNTGGYDRLETLALLDGVVDIYMPDMKYSHAESALKYSLVPNYPKVNRAAVKEMHRQVGDLILDDQDIAQRGLLVRHLVLPGGLAGTAEIVEFLAREISKNTYLNVMDQYRPSYRADQLPPLNRRITRQEYEEAVQLAHAAGLHRLDDRRRPILILR